MKANFVNKIHLGRINGAIRGTRIEI